MYSYNGVDWFEGDDPFGSDSGTDGEGDMDRGTPGGSGVTTGSVPGHTSSTHRTTPAAQYATAHTPTRPGAAIPMEVIAVPREGQEHLLTRPCVDCGLRTGSFCDGCLAVDRFPEEEWVTGQHTPLCTICDDRNDGLCHLCRGLIWAVPPPHGR